jgi:hypothetical protein
MTKRLVLFALLVSGCGAKEPAKSPATDPEAPQAEAQPKAIPAASREGTAAAPSKPSAAPASSAPATADDLRGVLQAVIDDEALTPYLRLEKPYRFPLRISGPNLPKDLQLTKATKPVVIVDDSNRDPKKPVLVFTEIDIKGDEASVRYKYDVEGVRGFATLHRPYGRWDIKQSRVAEH